jgi:hypothetical protein
MDAQSHRREPSVETDQRAPPAIEHGGSAALIVLAAILVAAAALILWLSQGVGVIGDQWAWIFSNLHVNLGHFFQDFNGHLMTTTYGAYAVLPLLGLGNFLVYRVVAVTLHLTVALLVYVLARRRLGSWLALAPAAVVAFLGTGADAFLSGLNYNVLAATAACLGALIALDRRSRGSQFAACGLLALGLASFSAAVAFTLGVGVELLCERDRRRMLWIPILPAGLYAAWRLHWSSSAANGHEGVFDVGHRSFQAATGAFSGLPGVQLANFSLKRHLPWLSPLAQIALALGLVLLLFLVARRRRVSPRLANLVSTGVALWLLIGIGRGSREDVYSSRYVYQGAIVAALILVEIASPYAIAGMVPVRIVTVGVAAAVVLNLLWMSVYAHHLRRESARVRAQLAALEIAKGRVPAGFRPATGFALGHVTAGEYFAAVQKWGDSPAFTTPELRRASEASREAADRVLVRAFRVELLPAGATSAGPAPTVEHVAAGTAQRQGSCLRVLPRGSTAVAEIGLDGSAGVVLEHVGPGTRIRARRFGNGYTAPLRGRANREGVATVLAPHGRVADPWHLRVETNARTTICSTQ